MSIVLKVFFVFAGRLSRIDCWEEALQEMNNGELLHASTLVGTSKNPALHMITLELDYVAFNPLMLQRKVIMIFMINILYYYYHNRMESSYFLEIMTYPLFPLNCYSLADWPRSRNITRTKSLFMYHYVAHK